MNLQILRARYSLNSRPRQLCDVLHTNSRLNLLYFFIKSNTHIQLYLQPTCCFHLHLLFPANLAVYILHSSIYNTNHRPCSTLILDTIPHLYTYFAPKLPHFYHFSMCSQTQPISILVIFRQNTKAIALLFGQNCLIFITFQCAVTILAKSKAIALVFCLKMTKIEIG